MDAQLQRPAYLLNPEFIEEYWAKVRKVDHPEACWIWQGFLHGSGYGIFRVDGEYFAAHRLAYEIANGPLAPKTFVGQTCRCRVCVRPDHLFLKDGTKKGRSDGFTPNRHLSKDIRSTIFKLSGSEVAPGVTVHMGGDLGPLQEAILPQLTRLGEGIEATARSLESLRAVVAEMRDGQQQLQSGHAALARQVDENMKKASGRLVAHTAALGELSKRVKGIPAAITASSAPASGPNVSRETSATSRPNVSRETSAPRPVGPARYGLHRVPEDKLDALRAAFAEAAGVDPQRVERAALAQVYGLAIDRDGALHVDTLQRWIGDYLAGARSRDERPSAGSLLCWAISDGAGSSAAPAG